MEFQEEGQSLARLRSAVDAARTCGFAAVSANDHFIFSKPWLDGPTALAAVADRMGEMTAATTISLVALRGPIPRRRCSRRSTSSPRGDSWPGSGRDPRRRTTTRWASPSTRGGSASMRPWRPYAGSLERSPLAPPPPPPPPPTHLRPHPRQSGGIPLWIGSWGSEGRPAPSRATGRWVARLGVQHDPRIASPPRGRFWPTSYRRGGGTRTASRTRSRRCGRGSPRVAPKRDRMLTRVLAPLLGRDPGDLRSQVVRRPAGALCGAAVALRRRRLRGAYISGRWRMRAARSSSSLRMSLRTSVPARPGHSDWSAATWS